MSELNIDPADDRQSFLEAVKKLFAEFVSNKSVEKDIPEVSLDQMLLLAIQLKNLDEINNLLSHGASPNAHNEHGFSVLEIANSCHREDKQDVVELLIEFGAINTLDSEL